MNFSRPTEQDERMIEKVIALASDAISRNKVGVAALLACGDEIIVLDHNPFADTQNPLDHAEIVVLNKAGSYLTKCSQEQKSKLTLYSTLEPCLICLLAASFVGIRRIVYAALAEDANQQGQLIKGMTARTINPYLTKGEMELIPGVKREQGKALLEQMGIFSSAE
ncbi:nucleoside deaminase [Gloeothece verrucosa]|uniref:CMP/dCMP deaminase zinc-binding protein n=1 Tax=Gloeothece verrucosa (strain PCC 7822) TaxID=497965 RepID=E0UDH8_GLOV7|nr:deaminase [Gloeothece verrucosa]ADN15291.1 CMP/dCMP deaminase zinc-binding protein [Gloeothece verrucosa PCC 7822]